MRRLIRPSIAAALVLVGLPATGAGGAPGDDLAACRAADQVQVRSDQWIRLRAPKVDRGEGPQTILDWATPPRARSRIYTTNGTVVKISADSGCTWNTMFTGLFSDANAPQTEQDVFTNVAAPSDISVWAASYDTAGDVEHPHVYVASGLTDDNLAEPVWEEASTGLPQVGRPVDLVGSTGQEPILYTVIEGPPDAASGDLQTPGRRLYVTTRLEDPPEVDAFVGMFWKELALPAGFGQVQGVRPTNGSGVWIWNGAKYAYAEDTQADAVSWQEGTVEGQIKAVDVTSRGVTTIAFATEQGGKALAIDGTTTATRPLPTSPTALGHGRMPGVYTVAGAGGTFGWDLDAKDWIDITPKGVATFSRIEMPVGPTGDRFVLAQAGNELYRFDLWPGERFLPPADLDLGTGTYDWDRTSTLTGPTLTPMRQVVTVEPGRLEDVPVTFGVPPTATPLDVYFLMDTTASMDSAIIGLRQSVKKIATKLHNTLGREACFGLGEFGDFILGDVQHTYTRRVPITCDKPVEKVSKALDELDARGGGDIPEAQTIGLTQAISGEGSVNPPVDAGQQALFRPGAFKVIVMISDSHFRQGQGYPTLEQTITTLDVADVKVVSVLITGNSDPDVPRRDMEAIAVGTSTFAPPGGVDCDGDGRRTGFDISGGAPLVCDTSGSDPNIGPAIIGLLLGVADPGSLRVDVQDKHDVVQEPIRGTTTKVVDLKQESILAFALPVMCTKAQDGLDLPVGLVPSVRAASVGLYGEVVVQCRAKAVVPPPAVAPPPQPEPVVEIVKPRPPVAVAIQPPPQPPAQPISNINLNAGFSQQEEQQFQLAAVTQGAAEGEQVEAEVELAMTGLDRPARDVASAAGLLAGATLMSAAAGVAYRRRLQRSRRTAAAYARF